MSIKVICNTFTVLFLAHVFSQCRWWIVACFICAFASWQIACISKKLFVFWHILWWSKPWKIKYPIFCDWLFSVRVNIKNAFTFICICIGISKVKWGFFYSFVCFSVLFGYCATTCSTVRIWISYLIYYSFCFCWMQSKWNQQYQLHCFEYRRKFHLFTW